MKRLKKDLAKETMENLVEALDRMVAAMNRRARLGIVRDWAFGEYLSNEMKARQIGNEIKRRRSAAE